MPPRTKKTDGEDKDTQASRLREHAIQQGVLTESQPSATVALPLSKSLVKSNGQDIIKKSTVRKNRYLLVLNCLLAPATSGKMGALANLDSQEPCMYLDFPKGRLKLFGTLVFPRNKYLLLRTGAQAGVMCEDVFENMIVFSETWWIGTPEENPEEKQLPMPSELATTTIHKDYGYAYGASYQGVRAGKATEDQTGASQQEPGSQQKGPGPSQEPPGSAARPRRAAAQKSYQDLASDNEDDDKAMEEEHDEGGHQGYKIKGAARAIRAAQHDPIEILSTDDPDEATGRSGKQGGRGSLDLEGKDKRTPSRRAAAPKRTLKDASSAEDEGDDDGTMDGSEEGGSMLEGSEDEKPKRQRKPVARKPPAPKPRKQARGASQPAAKRQRPDTAGKPLSGQKKPQPKRRKEGWSEGEEEVSDEDDKDAEDDGEEEEHTAAEQKAAAATASLRPARLPRRAAAKQIKYAETDEEEEEEEEEEEGESEEDEEGSEDDSDGREDSESGGAKARRRTASSQGRGRGGGGAVKCQSPEVFEINSDDD